MAKKAYPLSKAYRLLEPGPVVLMTTAHRGKADIMTQSWHTMMEFEPPLAGCVISRRTHSFKALTKTKEGVLGIPSVELAKQGELRYVRRTLVAADPVMGDGRRPALLSLCRMGWEIKDAHPH